MQHLGGHWVAQQEHLKEGVGGLLGVKAVRSAILRWWEFLVDLIKTNAKQPPDSKRALAYEERRREERLLKQRDFSHESTIVAAAINLGLVSITSSSPCSGPSTRSVGLALE